MVLESVVEVLEGIFSVEGAKAESLNVFDGAMDETFEYTRWVCGSGWKI